MKPERSPMPDEFVEFLEFLYTRFRFHLARIRSPEAWWNDLDGPPRKLWDLATKGGP